MCVFYVCILGETAAVVMKNRSGCSPPPFVGLQQWTKKTPHLIHIYRLFRNKFGAQVHSRVKWIVLPPKSTRAAGRNTRRLAALASCVPHGGDVKAAGFCRKHRGSTRGLVLVREFLGSTFNQKCFTTKSPSWKRSVRSEGWGHERPLQWIRRNLDKNQEINGRVQSDGPHRESRPISWRVEETNFRIGFC